MAQCIRALRRNEASGYNLIGNQLYPSVWPVKIARDAGNFRRFKRHSVPGDGPLRMT